MTGFLVHVSSVLSMSRRSPCHQIRCWQRSCSLWHCCTARYHINSWNGHKTSTYNQLKLNKWLSSLVWWYTCTHGRRNNFSWYRSKYFAVVLNYLFRGERLLWGSKFNVTGTALIVCVYLLSVWYHSLGRLEWGYTWSTQLRHLYCTCKLDMIKYLLVLMPNISLVPRRKSLVSAVRTGA